jgi:hypothetical protein
MAITASKRAKILAYALIFDCLNSNDIAIWIDGQRSPCKEINDFINGPLPICWDILETTICLLLTQR